MGSEPLDIGHDHVLRFYGFAPDRELNPQYAEVEDEPRAGAIIEHRKPDGSPCSGAVTFNTPAMRVLHRGSTRALWDVHSWDPLTVTPSILCACGDHGFITDGRWIPA